jgi:uncharacterized protein YcbK (DUF882 family)
MRKIIILFILMGSLVHARAGNRINFKVTVNKVPLEYNISSFSTMPGDTLHFVFTGNTSDQFVAQFSSGELIEDSSLNWRYIAPAKSGHYELIILHNNPPEKLILNLFVFVPASEQKGEYLNGYRIGNYPQKLYRNNPKYKTPKGFIEVTEATKDVQVSPHFRLNQFLCKQQPGKWPKYLLLDTRLLTKLEMVIERLERKGNKAGNMFIMSGYRTPFYNASIHNGKYSRHIYGDAADVYVDENHDGVIDDLNKDGKASMADAEVIYQVVESIEKKAEYKYLIGGMGKYNKTAAHTWDVHIDTRGYRARW